MSAFNPLETAARECAAAIAPPARPAPVKRAGTPPTGQNKASRAVAAEALAWEAF